MNGKKVFTIILIVVIAILATLLIVTNYRKPVEAPPIEEDDTEPFTVSDSKTIPLGEREQVIRNFINACGFNSHFDEYVIQDYDNIYYVTIPHSTIDFMISKYNGEWHSDFLDDAFPFIYWGDWLIDSTGVKISEYQKWKEDYNHYEVDKVDDTTIYMHNTLSPKETIELNLQEIIDFDNSVLSEDYDGSAEE